MNVFAEICIVVIPASILLHIMFLFLANDSRFQRGRFRKSLDRIYDKLCTAKENGIKYPTVDIIHKNKQFAIGIHKNEINYYYSTYEIYINGDAAGVYHRLKQGLRSSYYFETMNRRYTWEVEDIIRAADREIKKLEKATCGKSVCYDEHSYFN